MKRYAICLAVLAPIFLAGPSQALDNASVASPLKSKPDPKKAKLADIHTLIARAKEAVADDLPTLKVDIDNLFLALLRSKSITDQYNLIDAIREIGDLREGSSPVKVKAYVQQAAALTLPELPKSVQSFAATSWSRFFFPDKETEREIGIVAPQSPEMETAGLKVLRARGLGVSYDALEKAIQEADPELTDAVLKAGLQVGETNIIRTYEVVSSSLGTACQNPSLPAHRINAVLDLLSKNGFPVTYSTDFGHSMLFFVARECPGAVVERVITLGAPASQRDRKGVTPLEMALQSERFEAADVLMKYGARLSKTAAQRTLSFPGRDSRLEEYVKRATEPVAEAGK